MKRTIAAAVIGGVLLLGCGGADDEGTGDSPVNYKHLNDKPADVINFPDLFANVAWKCNGTDAIYVTTRNAAPVVIRDSYACGGGR